MQSWRPVANKQNNGSYKRSEEGTRNPSTTPREENVGVKSIEVGKVLNQNFYVAYVIIGISLSKPDPVIDKNLVIRQDYADVQ
jgi:hypothetical protein